ncbi:MAG TPA: iron uptake protein, partial [Pseudomonas sp.]|nr:iron uptake protein [Pseudomonas sp.]
MSRVFAAIFAVYAFIWGVVSLGVVSLSAIGVDFHSA